MLDPTRLMPPLLIEIGGTVKIRCYGEFFRCSAGGGSFRSAF